VFSSELQRARVCRAFCARARLGDLWTDERPTAEAMALVERDGGPLSSGERLLLLLAWSIWSGDGPVSVGDALASMDGVSLAMLGKLMTAAAQGSSAVDAWLTEHENGKRSVGHA